MSDEILRELQECAEHLNKLRDEVQNLKENHLHHLDLRLTKLETSLSIGWKAVLFGAGLPAILSAILSVVQMMNK